MEADRGRRVIAGVSGYSGVSAMRECVYASHAAAAFEKVSHYQTQQHTNMNDKYCSH